MTRQTMGQRSYEDSSSMNSNDAANSRRRTSAVWSDQAVSPCDNGQCWWASIGLGSVPHYHTMTPFIDGMHDMVTMLSIGMPWHQLSLEDALDDTAFPFGKGHPSERRSARASRPKYPRVASGLRPPCSCNRIGCRTSFSGPFAKRAGQATHALALCVEHGLA